MKTIVIGNNYKFYIVSDGIKFYIEALQLTTSRYSYINNLNAILSEFDIGIDDKKVSDSQWLVSLRQSYMFFEKASRILSNKNSRNHIEKMLDEDRKCGEWENLRKK